MTTRTQGLVMAALAVVLVRISLTGEYLRFVTPWMRWPLFVAGLILLLLAVRPALGLHQEEDAACHDADADAGHAGSRSAWLLLLPTLLVFAVTPPPLGAFLAERRGEGSVSLQKPVVVALPEGDEPVPLGVGEFSWGAAQKGDPMGLTDRRVTLSGFVSGKGETWFVTRLEIGCCAADASVMRVRVKGVDAPPRDQWVEVTGTWQVGTGGEGGDPPILVAERLEQIAAPEEVYG